MIFRQLNLGTELDCYPLPNMLDFTDNLSSCCIFSKIDLREGYFQILMIEDDIAKTAVVTQFGRQWSGQQRCHMFPGGKTCSG